MSYKQAVISCIQCVYLQVYCLGELPVFISCVTQCQIKSAALTIFRRVFTKQQALWRLNRIVIGVLDGGCRCLVSKLRVDV